jgi:hypothetical protein
VLAKPLPGAKIASVETVKIIANGRDEFAIREPDSVSASAQRCVFDSKWSVD